VTCLHGILLRCPMCGRGFCVPAACNGVEVWHRSCGCRLEVLERGVAVKYCERAVVSWFKDTDRNEVRTNEEY
jgi:hypothetical protein